MKRKILTKKSDYDFLKKIMTYDAFHNKFKLSMSLVSELLANDANRYSAIDSPLTKAELTVFDTSAL